MKFLNSQAFGADALLLVTGCHANGFTASVKTIFGSFGRADALFLEAVGLHGLVQPWLF